MQKSSSYKVLFLASWYPNRIFPKNGNFVQRHAQAVARVCDVVSLHVISDAEMQDFEVNVQELNGVCEVTVYFPKSANWRPFKKYKMYLEAHRRGYAWIEKNWGKIDITHLNIIYPAGLFALELKKKYGIPYVLSENWTSLLPINPYKFSLLEKHFIQKIGNGVSVFCPVSADLKNALMGMGFKGPYRIVPNVVDTAVFTLGTKKSEGELSAQPIKILHASTFKDDHKNISGLLRVIARLQNERSDFAVTMVGNKFGDQYEDAIRDLGISKEMLQILPEQPIEEVARLMQSHHIFVLFSNYENLPCVIAEAHCAGMLVVGTDVGGTREMIDATNGFVVQARDEQKLFESLQEVMDKLSTYQPRQIREKAVARYSYDSVAHKFLAVYKTILAKQA